MLKEYLDILNLKNLIESDYKLEPKNIAIRTLNDNLNELENLSVCCANRIKILTSNDKKLNMENIPAAWLKQINKIESYSSEFTIKQTHDLLKKFCYMLKNDFKISPDSIKINISVPEMQFKLRSITVNFARKIYWIIYPHTCSGVRMKVNLGVQRLDNPTALSFKYYFIDTVLLEDTIDAFKQHQILP